MLHLLPTRLAPHVHPASAPVSSWTDSVDIHRTAVDFARDPSPQVLVSEQEVLLSSAVATAAAPATNHRHWLGTTLFAAVRRIHVTLPEPQRFYPRREASYFEVARMSRHMDHL